MSLIMIIDLLFRLHIIIIRKSWFEGLRGGGLGGSLRIDSEPIRFDTLQFWHRFESIRDIAYFCQAWLYEFSGG